MANETVTDTPQPPAGNGAGTDTGTGAAEAAGTAGTAGTGTARAAGTGSEEAPVPDGAQTPASPPLRRVPASPAVEELAPPSEAAAPSGTRGL